MDCPDGSTTLVPTLDCFQTEATEEISPFLHVEEAAPPGAGRVGFTLFLLATAALLLRPNDLFPQLQDIPIYQTLVMGCLAVSLPRIWRQFSSRSPARPLTLLVIGILAAVIASDVARGALYELREGGYEFFKIVIYYLLILAWIDSPARMRHFLLCLSGCILILTILGLLQYDGWINLASLKPVEQSDVDPNSGALSHILRLCGVGISNDPNDLCLLLAVAMVLCFSFTGYRPLGRLRYGWFIPLGLFAYAVALTSSRGGLLALGAAFGTMLVARLGRSNAMLAAIVLLPMTVLAFSGRQMRWDLNDPSDTFQIRMGDWSDAMELFKRSPLVGCGQDQQQMYTGQVAHNSFIQSFGELGFFGGACFLGAFVMAINGVRRTAVHQSDPYLARMRPYMVGMLVGFAIGLTALSRAYTGPVYLVLGIAAAYINLTPRAIPLRLDGRFLRRLGGGSIVFVVVTYEFVRMMSV